MQQSPRRQLTAKSAKKQTGNTSEAAAAAAASASAVKRPATAKAGRLSTASNTSGGVFNGLHNRRLR